MPQNRQKWAEEQIAELLDMGDSIADAELFVTQALALIPEGEDLDTYIAPASVMMATAEVTSADVADARADWYASEDVPNLYKRLLDATEKEEET